jgi:hypothetical protein
MMAVLGLLDCPMLAASKLTVHRKWTHGFPLPDGPADARVCFPGVTHAGLCFLLRLQLSRYIS